MTVYIEKPAVNLREELASLRNQGGYEERQFYFDGLVTNGTFDTDTNWTKGTGWTISGGVATANISSLGDTLTQNGWATNVSGRVYKVTATFTMLATPDAQARVSINAGGIGQNLIVTSENNLVSGNTYTLDGLVAPTITNQLNIKVGPNANYAMNFTIDNISIYETDGTDVVHKMPKGWVPKDVFEDGLLQREGAAHDYEVVYDGFDYYVKPAVAPGATTETCVIGVRK